MLTKPAVEVPKVPRVEGDVISPLTMTEFEEPPRDARTTSETSSLTRIVERVSNVRVLQTSLPFIHEDIVERRQQAREAGKDPDLASVYSQPEEDVNKDVQAIASVPQQMIDPKTNQLVIRSQEEQDTLSRALRPSVKIPNAINDPQSHREKPDGMTPVPEKPSTGARPRARKWQFGIRSRNAPWEAMKCIYNALIALDAVWEIIPALASDKDANGNENQENRPPSPAPLAEGEQHTVFQSRYQHLPSDYYIPRDPWFIRARMLKRGMYAPGDENVGSSNTNSSANLAADHIRKRVEEVGGYLSSELMHASTGANPSDARPDSETASAQSTRPSSSIGDAPSDADPNAIAAGQIPSRSGSLGSIPQRGPNPNIGVWVFTDIQLYNLETDNYMVDFKCDGYQSVRFEPFGPNSNRTSRTGHSSRLTTPSHSRPASGIGNAKGPDGEGDKGAEKDEPRGEWRPVSKRIKNREKEITSPYPYLDVASDLIAQLAVAN